MKYSFGWSGEWSGTDEISKKKQILDEQWNTDYLEGLERIASEDSSNIRKADDTHYPRKAD